ncbi:virulence RhuM family protein [Algoriphagus sp. A40]|uniref:virulence RhuM family protein n=1 Tax=Algoriphagus sp. A40 TaxID=1945863 RepID=UPI0009850826|nr:virulence RhuM family protein [Algoriphagus sp. A40]OOG73022.1 cell filamentation protein Fic [Algoriphagus sp. A40]
MKPKDILLFQNADQSVNVSVYFQNGTFWLTQKTMAELFNVERTVITKHLNNIFKTGELDKDSVCAKIAHTAEDGKTYSTNFHRLEAILAVGYRVNSVQATDFRKWATQTLNEFIIKGFVMDDERMKQGKLFGQDYFDELLERIREIRASERRFYQKITDLYALSTDYDPQSQQTREFFGMVQNKLHWAITGKTAAEIIYTEADATKLYMGLKTWKDAPEGKIQKSDVSIAKNYLSHQHIQELNRIVSAYLDLAENNAQRGMAFSMQQWAKFLDSFLELSSYPILRDKGKVTMLEAKLKAESEFDKFRVIQDQTYQSDFDKLIAKTKK